MDILLKFLIFTLRTIDGNRDSANDLIRRFKKKDREAMSTMNFDSVFLQQSVRSANSSFSRSKNAQKPQPTLDDQSFYAICQKSFFKYQLLRVRSKLSFVALQKCMTIKELFMFGILKAYQIEIAQGDIVDNERYTVESNTLFLEYIGEETDLRNV